MRGQWFIEILLWIAAIVVVTVAALALFDRFPF